MDKRHEQKFHHKRHKQRLWELCYKDAHHLLVCFQNQGQSLHHRSIMNSHFLKSEVTQNRKYQGVSHTPSYLELFGQASVAQMG